MCSEKKWFRVLPLALVMGSIFFLSHQPGGSFSLPKITHIDKLLHCLLYAVLGLTVIVALPPQFRQRRTVLASSMVVLFCLCYGISDEFHQSFIPERTSDVFDVMADGAGGVLAVVCAWDWGGRRWRGE
jgi:VanZ family protein